MTRVLIGGVGYRNLRDHSCGVVLIDRLATREWPPHVVVEDISYGPIAVVQRLQDAPADARFDVAIIAGARLQPGRRPGSLSVFRWDGVIPGPGRIHEAVTEAVTGIISLDNTLVVARHFDALPQVVVVVEIEPGAHDFGEDLTPAVVSAVEHASEVVVKLALNPTLIAYLPERSLGTLRAHHSGIVLQVPHGDTGIH